MSAGDRPPSWMLDPNRISSNGFLIRSDQQPRYYFRPDRIRQSAILEKSGPRQVNWPALVAGIVIVIVLAIVIVVVTTVVVTNNSREVSQTTLSPNSSVAQSIGLSMPTTTTPTTRTTATTTAATTTTTTAAQMSNSQAPRNAGNPNPQPVQLPSADSTVDFSTDQTTPSSSSSSSTFSAVACSNHTWIKMSSVYAADSFQQFGITSPADCQSLCLSLSGCQGVMWYAPNVEGCYLTYRSTFDYYRGPNYIYYSLNRNQSNCDANSSCTYIWIGEYDSHVLGAVRNPNISTLNSCIAFCQNNLNCSAVDWDVNQNYCWHFLNTNQSTQTQYTPGIHHFNKECRDPYATTSTTVTTTEPMISTEPSVCPYWSRYCEPTGACLYPYQICDKYQDCPNDIDEINCTCDSNHYQCQNGRCIYRSWLCDGVDDCPLKDDESQPQCSTCGSSQFLCGKTHTCIPASLQCDGVPDCSSSEDEVNCIMLSVNGTTAGEDNFTTSLVSATYYGMSGYLICADNWNETWSDSICQNIGYRKSSATSFTDVRGVSAFLELNLSVSSPNLLAHLQTSRCLSNRAVAVSCADSECGTRGDIPPDSVGPYVINGQRAKRGAWPWQVLYEIGYYGDSKKFYDFAWLGYCGGVIINDRWILTAAHCTQTPPSFSYSGQVKPANVRISLGSLSRLGDDDTVYARVDQVHTHPSYTDSPVTDNDVGLLRLSEPLNFTDTVRPICLPTRDEDISQFRVCVDTGFGRTNRDTASDYLLQVRMNVIPYRDCAFYYDYYLRGQTQICIGTLPTEYDNNLCLGDSGGPFACEDYNGVWKVFGINSYVIGLSDNPCARSIVARVTAYVDWIEQTMAANSV